MCNHTERVFAFLSLDVFKYIIFKYTIKYLYTEFKYIETKVFISTLINIQMYINTAKL